MFEKLDIRESCETIENNQLKCNDYSLLFSMCADVDGQHFN